MSEAAIFDVDGTIIPGSAEKRFAAVLLGASMIGFKDFGRWLKNAMMSMFDGANTMFRGNKSYLSGLDVVDAEFISYFLYYNYLSRMIPRDVREEIKLHRAEGRKIVLISGMPEFILKHFAMDLDVDAAVGCKLETSQERYTGMVHGMHPFGPAKREILLQLAKLLHIDLQNSSAYGNHYSDRFFLSITGTPVAVNPDRRLHKYANRHNWLIIDDWFKTDVVSSEYEEPNDYRLGLEHWLVKSRN